MCRRIFLVQLKVDCLLFFSPKYNLNCLCSPKRCLERGEMEEGWAGSCEGIVELVWEARAEDQALGKGSWCYPTVELQEREAGSEGQQ